MSRMSLSRQCVCVCVCVSYTVIYLVQEKLIICLASQGENTDAQCGKLIFYFILRQIKLKMRKIKGRISDTSNTCYKKQN